MEISPSLKPPCHCVAKPCLSASGLGFAGCTLLLLCQNTQSSCVPRCPAAEVICSSMGFVSVVGPRVIPWLYRVCLEGFIPCHPCCTESRHPPKITPAIVCVESFRMCNVTVYVKETSSIDVIKWQDSFPPNMVWQTHIYIYNYIHTNNHRYYIHTHMLIIVYDISFHLDFVRNIMS